MINEFESSGYENLSRLNKEVEQCFVLDENMVVKIAECVAVASQYELDRRIHYLATMKHPGLKQQIAESICGGDQQELAGLVETAQRQAIIGTELRFCRKAVSQIMYRNRYEIGDRG